MQIILFEDKKWSRFLPLVFTRPVGDLLIGIQKISEKYAAIFNAKVYHETRVYLHELFPVAQEVESLHINARLIPDEKVVSAILSLKNHESLMHNDVMLAHRSVKYSEVSTQVKYDGEPLLLTGITDIFAMNGTALKMDFDRIRKGRTSAPLHDTNVLIGDPSQLYIAPNAKVYATSINVNDGPVFIDEHAEVMEGSHIRGPFYLGEYSTIKMGSKVYGPTSIGPHSKFGGEISNCVVHGFSNKAHDGFIGNSVIGEWCNLGADTNTSNLKNNYSQVRVWSYAENQFTDTGLTFCGLIMGDHSKCGINTMFNTGTVAGVCANIFGAGFPIKHIPSFTWGGGEDFEEYHFSKAIETIRLVMARRDTQLSAENINVLKRVFDDSHVHRLIATQSQE